MNHYDDNSASMEMYCDAASCSGNEVFYGSYQECIDEAKEQGWGLKKGDEYDEWFHFCPDHNPWKRPDGPEMFRD